MLVSHWSREHSAQARGIGERNGPLPGLITEGIALDARAPSLFKHHEHPPAAISSVDKGGGVNVEHDPCLESLVVIPEPRGGFLAFVNSRP